MGVAQDWANNCAARGMMYHSNHPNDQENIYATSGRVSSGREAVDCFYKEIQYYRFGSMGFTMQTGKRLIDSLCSMAVFFSCSHKSKKICLM
jgi:hypothetical protein